MKLSFWHRVLSCAAGALLVTGCEAPNVFRNAPAQRPHASLISADASGLRGFMGFGRKVSPSFINDQPTAFWRLRESFRLPAGETVLKVSDVCRPYGYAPMRFTAVAGRCYVLRPTRTGSRDAATLSERAPGNGVERVISTALRDVQ